MGNFPKVIMGINSGFGALVWPIEEYRFNPGHCKQNAVILNLSTSILTDVTVSINLSFFSGGGRGAFLCLV